MLPVHSTVEVDLVAFILRDVEGVSIGIETAVFGHGPAGRPLAKTVFRQGVEKMVEVIDQPGKETEARRFLIPGSLRRVGYRELTGRPVGASARLRIKLPWYPRSSSVGGKGLDSRVREND